MRILFTGGGTGGHIFPIIAVKREIDKILKDCEDLDKTIPSRILEGEYMFVGGGLGNKKAILEREKIRTKEIVALKWRRYLSAQNFLDILKAPFVLFQSLLSVWLFMPDAIFSKGGPSSFFVVFVGWLYRIPVITHESDSIPGLTNKVSFPFSKRVAISFKESLSLFPKKKTIVTGHPVRQMLTEGSKERAKDFFKLSGKRKVILITGGSQGAQQINLVFIDAIYKYIEKYEIIHICGEANFKEVSLLTKGLLKKEQTNFYHLYPSLEEENLKDAYAAADIIISRAGAGAIFEIAAIKKPSILIPLEGSASDHQDSNAQIFGENQCSIIIESQNVSPNVVFLTIKDTLDDDEKIEELIQACAKFAPKNAAREAAKLVIEMA